LDYGLSEHNVTILTYEVQGDNAFTLKCLNYSKYLTQLLNQLFDTNIKVSIQNNY